MPGYWRDIIVWESGCAVFSGPFREKNGGIFTSWATGEIPKDPGKTLGPQLGTYLMAVFSGTDRRWPLVVWTAHEASYHHPVAWGTRGAQGPVGTKSKGQGSRGPRGAEDQREGPEDQRTQKIQGTWRTLRTQRTKRTTRTWYFLLPPLLLSSLSSCFHSCPLNLLAFASLSQLPKFNIQWLSFLSLWIWLQTIHFFPFLKWGSPCTSIFSLFLFVNHCTLTGLLLWSWMRG